MKIKFHPLAREDYRRQFAYLREAGVTPQTLQDYINGLREAERKIVQNPATWSYVAGSRFVRRVHVRQFRLQVFYLIRPDGVPFVLEIAGPGLKPRWYERL